jgi:hypothetical protein
MQRWRYLRQVVAVFVIMMFAGHGLAMAAAVPAEPAHRVEQATAFSPSHHQLPCRAACCGKYACCLAAVQSLLGLADPALPAPPVPRAVKTRPLLIIRAIDPPPKVV